ncbi:hypothetical protein F5Y08DRAFT_313503 [Xylaria arbuscula]|nr:hypothetical protein F5Y08DRAFT_313503 [Xylaria arbuscula]
MPPDRFRPHELQDANWKENKETLRRLYLTERRTLKDVKKKMETEHGFPTTPLSTYESKLRDLLGLRKKMKSQDWRPVYRHYLDSGNRHTALYFNGTRIPWGKAWKEIKRSGARISSEDDRVGLPAGVIMRTPSPGLARQASSDLRSKPPPWDLADAAPEDLEPDALIRRWNIYNIPTNVLRVKMLNVLQQQQEISTTRRNESSINPHCLPNSKNQSKEQKLMQWPLVNFNQVSLHENRNIDVDRLSNALYRLANGNVRLTRPREPLDEPLDVIFNQTPQHIIEKLLEGNSPTLQLAVKNLIQYSVRFLRIDDFRNIVRAVSISHPEWVIHGEYLKLAGIIGCNDTCRLLLRMPYCLRYYHEKHYDNIYILAIMESVARGHDECATALYQHLIQPTTTLSSQSAAIQSTFVKVLPYIGRSYHSRWDGSIWQLGLGEPLVLQTLNWFLEAGVNINAPIQTSEFQTKYHYTRHTPKNWMPTILDDLYFVNLQLYSHLDGHSIPSRIEITRSGIRHAARGGTDALRMYLLSHSSHTPVQQDKLLGIFLTEELLRSAFAPQIDFDAIQTLIDYTPSLPYFGMKLTVSAMLYYVIRSARRQGIPHTTLRILEILIHKGAHVVTETIEAAVEREGTALLQALSSYSADFSTRGALALCTAMQLDNYAAVSWLLDRGVECNATLWDDQTHESLTVVARANTSVLRPHYFHIFDYKVKLCLVEPLRPMSCAMLEYAMFRNMRLRTNPNDPYILRFLWLIISNIRYDSPWPDTFKKVQLVLTAGTADREHESSSLESCLLKACFDDNNIPLPQSLALMELLLEHRILTNSSDVLTHLIAHRAPRNKIYRVLESDINVNVYSSQVAGYQVAEYSAAKYEVKGYPVKAWSPPSIQRTPLQAAANVGSLHWVEALIERGANVNQPAQGFRGRTALQAACENGEDIDLIRLLLIRGANVNAPPSPETGLTAFQAAAMRGDFEIVLLLLDHGADINAPPSAQSGYCALDGAAACELLDMVQFLLDLGALSYKGGESGYKGAIYYAERSANPAIIADMIRQHALKQGKCGEELTLHYTQWEDKIPSPYCYDTDSASEASDIDSDLDFEI